jgi:Flp pilus assembly protein TadB
MGARPLDVLFVAPAGQAALVVGVGLDAVGVLWTSRIVGRAGGDA